MNNDFGWKHLPCSFLKENTVFLLITANFFTCIVSKVTKVFKEIKNVSRIKRFVFRFIAVPAK